MTNEVQDVTPKMIVKIEPKHVQTFTQVDETFTVLEKPNLVFGGISNVFSHAVNTEDFLIGKTLNDEAVIQEAVGILAAEVDPTPDYVLASVEYRKYLPQALFYKVNKQLLQ